MSDPSRVHPSAFVHESSYVDDDVRIGAGTKVWHFVHVSRGATLGDRCVLGQNVFVGVGVQVGAGVKVQNNVSLYTGVEVEDDVFLGPSCVFTNVHNPRAFVERKDEFRPTRVRRGASVGANATIVAGNELGEFCFVGAGAVVTDAVPPFGLVYGAPARLRGWMCRCGEKLASLAELEGTREHTCRACGAGYRLSREACVAKDDA